MSRSSDERIRIEHAKKRLAAYLDSIDVALRLPGLPIGADMGQGLVQTAQEIAVYAARHDAFLLAEGDALHERVEAATKPSCATCGRPHGDGWNPRHPFKPQARVEPGTRNCMPGIPPPEDCWRCRCGIVVANHRHQCPACERPRF